MVHPGPIFVPMLMSVGIAPELTQVAFRISDSAVNVCTPMFAFYPLIIIYCQKYYKKTGVGTVKPYAALYHRPSCHAHRPALCLLVPRYSAWVPRSLHLPETHVTVSLLGAQIAPIGGRL